MTTSARHLRLGPRAWAAAAWHESAMIARVYRLLLAGSRRRGGLLLALVLFQASVPVAQIWLTKAIVDGLVADDGSAALFAGAMLAALHTLASVLQPVQDVLATRVQDRGVAEIDLALIRAGTRLRDMVRISDPVYRERMGPVRQGADVFSAAIFAAGQWYGGVLSLVGVLLSLAGIAIWIPLVLLTTGLLAHLLAQRQSALEYATIWELARAGGELSYAKWIATRPESAAEVRMFGLGPWFRARYGRLATTVLEQLTAARRKGVLWAAGGSALHVTALAAALWYVARRAEAGTISPGELALVINALIQAQLLSWSAFQALAQLHDLGRKAGDFFAFVDAAGPEIALPPPGDGKRPPDAPATGVSLRNVAFSYPHDDQAREILHDVSLDLPAGAVTALVGDNGAGKSTLVGLLSRMFDPTAGTITLDGVLYAAYDLTALRERLTVVYQQEGHFALPLEDNIAIGDTAFSWGDPDAGRVRARAVGGRVGIDTIATSLPHGYRTELTRTFAEAVELSGGQWQLVAFARGLIRDDAALAMFDEPSSALDPLREAEQIEHLRRYAHARRRSVLIISHRLSTVRWADQIAVLDRGRIVEAGTHGDLLARDGHYAGLFRLQANRYRTAGEDHGTS